MLVVAFQRSVKVIVNVVVPGAVGVPISSPV
jgi:hypothetical protein